MYMYMYVCVCVFLIPNKNQHGLRSRPNGRYTSRVCVFGSSPAPFCAAETLAASNWTIAVSLRLFSAAEGEIFVMISRRSFPMTSHHSCKQERGLERRTQPGHRRFQACRWVSSAPNWAVKPEWRGRLCNRSMMIGGGLGILASRNAAWSVAANVVATGSSRARKVRVL